VKTRFAAKNLKFKNAIIFCYARQKFVNLQQKVNKAQVWAIVEVVIFCLNPIVSTFVINQFKGH